MVAFQQDDPRQRQDQVEALVAPWSVVHDIAEADVAVRKRARATQALLERRQVAVDVADDRNDIATPFPAAAGRGAARRCEAAVHAAGAARPSGCPWPGSPGRRCPEWRARPGRSPEGRAPRVPRNGGDGQARSPPMRRDAAPGPRPLRGPRWLPGRIPGARSQYAARPVDGPVASEFFDETRSRP